MADTEPPQAQNNETCPKLHEPRFSKLLRKRHSVFALTFFVAYSVMLISLLATNDELPEWTNYVQAVVGSVLALLVFCAVVLSLCVSTPALRVLLLLGMFGLASIALSVLDAQFAHTLETRATVSFQLPAHLPVFVLVTTLPAFFPQEPIPILLIGSMTNLICFGFHLANFRNPQPILYLVIYEMGVLALATKFDPQPVQNAPKLIATSDLSVSKNTVSPKAETEEAAGSELEAILLRLERIYSNAEEAVHNARTEEELQRASESEMLMRDLMQRLKTKNIYAVSPEKFTQHLSDDEKKYIEETCFPQAVPTKTVRRRDRMRSSTFYTAIEPMKYSLTELIPLLSQIGKQWNFDTDFLTACADGHPVSTVGDYLFRILHLNKRLALSADLVQRFFEKLDEGYLPNPYHNSTHAADVMFSVMFLSKSSGLLFYSSDLEVAACVVATLGHDVGHLGYNNRYMVNSRHVLATNCTLHSDNDISVLEMMHASKTFHIAQDTKAFEQIQGDAWVLFRRQVVEMVLATDMAKHFELLTQFRVTLTTPQLDDQIMRFFLYKMMLKCGDIGHAAKNTELHERWSLRVMEEFFKQGDSEKEQNLPVSMFCDRETTDIGKVQCR